MAIADMLLGALLVSVGFLTSALADRIRGIRALRAAEKAAPSRRAPVIDLAPAEPSPTPPPTPPKSSRLVKTASLPAGSADVIEALIATGYKRPAATQAVLSCTVADRATLEGWTCAALRLAGRAGGLS